MQTESGDLICGAEAARLLGVNHKSGSLEIKFREFGIEPVYIRKTAHRSVVFLKLADVLTAKEALDRKKEDENNNNGKENFASEDEVLKLLLRGHLDILNCCLDIERAIVTMQEHQIERYGVLERIEKKLDTLLSAWE